MYQIGRAEDPDNDDPRYDTEAEAIDAAQHAATGDTVWAIWRYDSEEDPTTIYLVYQGDLWRPA
jgi:hypothetical protein